MATAADVQQDPLMLLLLLLLLPNSVSASGELDLQVVSRGHVECVDFSEVVSTVYIGVSDKLTR